MSHLRNIVLAIMLMPAISMAAGAGVDIGSDASQDHKTSENSKITREKSATRNRDQRSSDRQGSERSREQRRENSEVQSNRSGYTYSQKNAWNWGYNGVTALLKALSQLEKTDGSFCSCAILHKSSVNDFPVFDPISQRITWLSKVMSNPMFKPLTGIMAKMGKGIQNPFGEYLQYGPVFPVDDTEPEFDDVKSYFQCWMWYGELMSVVADELKTYQQFASEKEVVQISKDLFRKYNTDTELRQSVFSEFQDIDSCYIPTIDGLSQEPLVITCGSIRIYPRLATAEVFGAPLFNGQSVKGRLLRLDIASSVDAHKIVERTTENRRSSGTSSRTFNAHDQSTEEGRSLSIRRAQSSDQSISSDQDIRSSESFKATPP